jgi:hypothetical protein
MDSSVSPWEILAFPSSILSMVWILRPFQMALVGKNFDKPYGRLREPDESKLCRHKRRLVV